MRMNEKKMNVAEMTFYYARFHYLRPIRRHKSMLFCRAVEINGGHNYGEFGDCGLFGLNTFALSFLIYLTIHRYNSRGNTDDKSVLHVRGNKYVYYAYLSNVLLQLLLSIAILLGGVLFNVEGTTAIAFYVDQSSRLVGWMLSLQSSHSFLSYRSPVLYCTLGWGVCQVATGGMNCIYYGMDKERVNGVTSISLLGYFAASIFYLALVVRQLVR
jgi:hypothetical protein